MADGEATEIENTIGNANALTGVSPSKLGEPLPTFKNDSDLADFYNGIGVWCYYKGEYDEAISFHQKSLTVREKVHGKEHACTAESYKNMGIVFDSKGKYDEALSFFNKATAVYEQILGNDHPTTADSYNNVGMIYDSKGQFDEAATFYDKI